MKKFMSLLLLVTSSTVLATEPSQDSGKQLYDAACQRCHAPRFAPAIQAPSAFNKENWQIVMARAKQQAQANPKKYPDAYAYLLQQIKIGKGLMHHGGLCRETAKAVTCDDKTYKAAIDYMRTQK